MVITKNPRSRIGQNICIEDYNFDVVKYLDDKSRNGYSSKNHCRQQSVMSLALSLDPRYAQKQVEIMEKIRGN